MLLRELLCFCNELFQGMMGLFADQIDFGVIGNHFEVLEYVLGV